MKQLQLLSLATLTFFTSTVTARVPAAKKDPIKKETESKKTTGAAVRISTEAQYAAFLKNAEKNNKIVVLKFYADWCGACKTYAPNFDDVASMRKDAVFATLNIDDEDVKDIARCFNVVYLPTTVIMDVFVGSKSKENLAKRIPQPTAETTTAQPSTQSASKKVAKKTNVPD